MNGPVDAEVCSGTYSAGSLASSAHEGREIGVLHRKAAFYRPELDVLRFCAFLAVFVVHSAVYPVSELLAHHIPLWAAEIELSVARAGAYGVDVFFVLSAYLITELLLREKQEKGKLDVKSFYIRRMLRIWPLYYFFVPLVALVPFLNPLHAFSARYVAAFLLLAGNWSFVLFGWPNSVAVPLWSISVEEQFYLLWPPMVSKLSRRKIILSAIGMVILANAVRVWALWRHSTSQQLWGNTFAHLDSIAAGILIAALLRGAAPKIAMVWRFALLVGAATILSIRGHYVTILPDDALGWRGTILGYPLVTVACAVIVLAFIGTPLRSSVLIYLGKISYGLYVYHLMCIAICDRVLPEGHGLLNVFLNKSLALGLTISIAALSYAVLEQPFLRLKRKFTYVQSRPA